MIIPSFAIGRAQQLLYHFSTLFHSGRVPRFPVYLDSPMANAATRVYEHHPELWDEEMTALVKQGVISAQMPEITRKNRRHAVVFVDGPGAAS